MATAAVRTVLEMTVHENRVDEFRATWLATARAAARLPGCVAQTLLRDPSLPHTYLIMADWADGEALDAFRRSPARAELSARLEEFRASAHRRVLDAVAHVPAHHTVER
ncbi:putative quinol monooxygenase [Streptomyces sp. NPDC014894]|uniref:putative quinol monooxygenase n=1 Tax=unclassified Streptomyces TaxID=2593676 RepID=UPI0037017EF5